MEKLGDAQSESILLTMKKNHAKWIQAARKHGCANAWHKWLSKGLRQTAFDSSSFSSSTTLACFEDEDENEDEISGKFARRPKHSGGKNQAASRVAAYFRVSADSPAHTDLYFSSSARFFISSGSACGSNSIAPLMPSLPNSA